MDKNGRGPEIFLSNDGWRMNVYDNKKLSKINNNQIRIDDGTRKITCF